MGGPRVSVIVPCFNYGHLLDETLSSVQGQSLSDLECIVVDDGSTDSTPCVATRFCEMDPRFSYTFQNNRGLSAARNAGLRLAKGRYIQLLDADDLVAADKLTVQSKFLDEHADIALVYGPVRYFESSRKRAPSRRPAGRDEEWMRMGPLDAEAFLAAMLEGNIFPVCAPVFRREIVDQVGIFDEQLTSHEDWEFWLRVAFAGNRSFGLDERQTMSLIREHPGSMSKKRITMWQTRVELRRHLATWGLPESLRRRNEELMYQEQSFLGIAYVRSGALRQGIGECLRGFMRSSEKLRLSRRLAVGLAPDWLRRAGKRLFSLESVRANHGA
jgi:GT2 family glycosyltransferase